MPDPVAGMTTTTPTSGFGTMTGATPSTATSKPGGELGKDAFLKLLVAQLKYQNPLQPTDPGQFLGQTAQFTMVEKLEEISRAQSDLTSWQKVSAGQALVGHEVAGTSEFGREVRGLVTGLTLSADGPRLVLADGSTLLVGEVSQVALRAAATPAPAGSAAAPASPGSAPAPQPTAPEPEVTESGTPGTGVSRD